MSQKAFLVGADLGNLSDANFSDHMQELELLSETAGYEIVKVLSQKVSKINSSLYLGSGKVDEILSLAKYHNVNYGIINIIVNNERKYINGVAEFGHIISENNGGKAEVDNLILQCKTCNTHQGKKNINLSQINVHDCEMIDVYDPDNIELGDTGIQCKSFTVTNKRCKYKCLDGREFCTIHLIN